MKSNHNHSGAKAGAVLLLALPALCGLAEEKQTMPRPRQITYASCGRPSDALALFDGGGLGHWCGADGGPAAWPVAEDGTMRVEKRGDPPQPYVANIYTRESFTNFQLHLEFRIPESCKAMQHPQWRGNSGVLIFGCYEVQILGSMGQETYADGLCGAIYERHPPQVLACRDFGQWESYDIIFHAPCVENGKAVEPATMTLLQNGVVIQDHCAVRPRPDTAANAVLRSGRIGLQSHNDKSEPVNFRNIWIRHLP